MAEAGKGLFHADFTYTEDVLADFEALYQLKKEIPTGVRVAMGALGLAGAAYFGWALYRYGLQIAYVGYLLICSVMLVLAFSRGSKRPDDSLKKYRKYYLDKGAAFTFDDGGLEMQLEGQKNRARSKYREVYGLFDTDLCYYFGIKGRAYYIVPKASVEGGTAEEFRKYVEKKCAKRFQHFDLAAK